MKRPVLHALLIAALVLIALPAAAQSVPDAVVSNEVAPDGATAPQTLFPTSPCAPATMTPAEPGPALAGGLEDSTLGSTPLSSGCNAGAPCRYDSQCYCYDYLCACINRKCTCAVEL